MARGSRYGSISHQHADQGSFCLKYGGKTLISPSGCYGRCYGTPHHRLWTNTFQAHNTLLVDGQGQATWSPDATAQVCSALDLGDRLTGVIDGARAYPQMTAWLRTFTLTRDTLVVLDEVTLREPGSLTWCLHMLSLPQCHGLNLSLIHRGLRLLIRPLEGLPMPPRCTDRFAIPPEEGVPAGLTPALPSQYHAQWQTPPALRHRIQVSFTLV